MPLITGEGGTRQKYVEYAVAILVALPVPHSHALSVRTPPCFNEFMRHYVMDNKIYFC